MKSPDDSIWEERLKRCREIMRDLEDTEFKGKLKKTPCLGIKEIPVRSSGNRVYALIYMRLLKYWAVIYLDKSYEVLWDNGFNGQEIRDTLRHELLHLELMRGDNDPIFRKEAVKRGISLNTPSREAMCWLCSHCVQNCKKCAWEMTESCISFFPKKS